MSSPSTISVDPREIDIPTISIISSHKISIKTTRCLSLLYPTFSEPQPVQVVAANSSLPSTRDTPPCAQPPPPISAASTQCTPKAVGLRAKATVASKAITISEILKRRIAEKGERWWQYCVLSQVEVEVRLKDNPKKNAASASQTQPDSTDSSRQSKKRKLGSLEVTQDSDNSVNPTEGSKEVGKGTEEEDDEEDPFEVMPEKPKVEKKVIPLLTIYVARERIAEFARLYGEQTGGGEVT